MSNQVTRTSQLVRWASHNGRRFPGEFPRLSVPFVRFFLEATHAGAARVSLDQIKHVSILHIIDYERRPRPVVLRYQSVPRRGTSEGGAALRPPLSVFLVHTNWMTGGWRMMSAIVI